MEYWPQYYNLQTISKNHSRDIVGDNEDKDVDFNQVFLEDLWDPHYNI